jgi:hypothetical protein
VIFARYALLLGSLLLLAQESHRKPLPPIPIPPVPVAKRTVDVASLKLKASELATLAQSIPTDIEHVAKDLDDKLKRIEKLSKQLRRELSPKQKRGQCRFLTGHRCYYCRNCDSPDQTI